MHACMHVCLCLCAQLIALMCFKYKMSLSPGTAWRTHQMCKFADTISNTMLLIHSHKHIMHSVYSFIALQVRMQYDT